MKQPENNEIDTLLRGWGSNGRSGSAIPSHDVAGSHLDADELSSYAEGVLPVAARARYTAHLIDCDECRRLVTQLTAAVPLPAGEQLVTTVNPSWRERLAALFAPSVLKYAVPSLAVLVIAVVFFATRKPEAGNSVALTAAPPSTSASSASPAVIAADPVTAQGDAAGPSQKTAQPARSPQNQPTPPTSDDRQRADGADNNEQAKQKAGAGTTAANEASRKAETDKKEKRAEAASETVNVAPPPQAAAPASTAKVAADAPKDANAGARDDIEVNKVRSGPSKGDAASKNAAAGRGQDKTEPSSLSTLQPAGAPNDQQRTVAGRKFKREDGKWIDAGYKSSMAVTTISRGSEQFRALVADEPEIGAISRQLSGEVIVVWKGRAYRIN